MDNKEQQVAEIIAGHVNEIVAETVVEEIPVEWQWERLRVKRDSLLKKSDYRVIADAPWDKQPWLEYRQALRDLTETNSDPKLIVFPNPPA
jgi:hypothetical protein